MHIALYKPNNDMAKGFAIQFSKKNNKKELPCLWVEAIEQSQPKPAPGSTKSAFDWSDKIVMKIEFSEMGQILATIRGRQDRSRELFHRLETNDGVRETSLSFQTYKDNFWINFTRKQNNVTRQVSLPIDQAEACLIEELICEIIRDYLAAQPRRYAAA